MENQHIGAQLTFPSPQISCSFKNPIFPIGKPSRWKTLLVAGWEKYAGEGEQKEPWLIIMLILTTSC